MVDARRFRCCRLTVVLPWRVAKRCDGYCVFCKCKNDGSLVVVMVQVNGASIHCCCVVLLVVARIPWRLAHGGRRLTA